MKNCEGVLVLFNLDIQEKGTVRAYEKLQIPPRTIIYFRNEWKYFFLKGNIFKVNWRKNIVIR